MPALYGQVVLDHYRHPRGRGELPGHTHAAAGANPLCGDRVRIEVRCGDGRILELRHSGEACAVATAAASMLSEFAIGLGPAEVRAAAARFGAFVAGEGGADGLGPFASMQPLRDHPQRRKCALLAWAALDAALSGAASATSET